MLTKKMPVERPQQISFPTPDSNVHDSPGSHNIKGGSSDSSADGDVVRSSFFSILDVYLRFSKLRNSSLVFALDRMQPNIQLVVVVLLVFCTPRITMHRWLDSMTTATP